MTAEEVVKELEELYFISFDRLMIGDKDAATIIQEYAELQVKGRDNLLKEIDRYFTKMRNSGKWAIRLKREINELLNNQQ